MLMMRWCGASPASTPDAPTAVPLFFLVLFFQMFLNLCVVVHNLRPRRGLTKLADVCFHTDGGFERRSPCHARVFYFSCLGRYCPGAVYIFHPSAGIMMLLMLTPF